MLARCARCQGTFTTDRYGQQTCPHCGSELILPPPPGAPPEAEQVAPPPPPPAQTPPPPSAGEPRAGGGSELPPPPGPPPGGYGTPPGWGAPPGGGWGPPPGGGWGPPPGGGWGPPPGPPPPPGPEAPSPFADRARLGFFRAFLETWKLVATQPEPFFARVRKDQTGAALLFGIVGSTIGALASAFYGWLSGKQAAMAMHGVLSGMPEEQARFMRMWLEASTSGTWALAQVALTPVLVFIGAYVGAAILHLLLRLFRGAHRGFDATLTVVAYAYGLNVLLAVPGCGSLLVLVWSLVAVIIGLAAAHRCGVVRSAAAVLAPAALLLVCCCGLMGAGLPALLKGAGEAARQNQTTTL